MRFASALQTVVSLSRVIFFERSLGTGQRQRRQAMVAGALSPSRVARADSGHSKNQAVRSIALPIMLALAVACIAEPAAAQESGTTGRLGATMPPSAESQQTQTSPPTAGPPRDTRGGQGTAGGSSGRSDGPGPGGGTSGGSGGTTGRSGPGGGSGPIFPK